MGINVTKARIPVQFEFSEDIDRRFNKVKVWIAHTGENLNNSYFSKETLEKMALTLPKIPIVGYIEVDKDGENDFSDHRQEIVIKSGSDVDIRYAGHAYGFLPDDCNYQFEIRDGKEWLTAEGWVWTKFKDAIDIFNEVNGVKSHSMEIEQAEGEVDDIGRMVISSAVFSALCVLGEDVPPAMTGSTIEFFNERKNQYQFELKEMIKEFEREKGELDLPETNEVAEQVTEEVIETVEEVIDEVIDEVVVETPEVVEETVAEEFSSVQTEEVVDEPAEEPVGETVEEPAEGADTQMELFTKKSITMNFQLSHDDQRNGLYSALKGRLERGYHYIYEMFNDYAIVEQVTYDEDYENYEGKLLKINFNIVNDEIELGEAEEVFPMYLTASEKVTIDNQRTEIQELNTRLSELNEFKLNAELSEKESLVNEYAEQLDEEVVNQIKSNFSTLTVEEVEKEVALQFFKKAKAEKVEDATKVQATNFSAPKKSIYGELDRFFK